MGWLWHSWLPPPPDELLPQYQHAVLVVAIMGVVQMLAEVPLVLGQVMMFVRLKVQWRKVIPYHDIQWQPLMCVYWLC